MPEQKHFLRRFGRKLSRRGLVIVLVGILVLFCAPKVRMGVLIHMMDAQEAYFRKVMLADYDKVGDADLEIVSYGTVDSIENALEHRNRPVGLIKVPFSEAAALVARDRVMPLNSFLSQKELDEFSDTYLLTTLGKSDGKFWYVPRKFETRIMVYRKSKVADAVEVWRDYRDGLSVELAKVNDRGLPSTYLLEDDPNKWDYFDILMIGWIWSHREYAGGRRPRVAHRGKRYSGTSLRVIDRVYQLGGDSSDVVSMKGEAVTDAFFWEAVYAGLQIYNPRMWKEGWSGTGVWEGFRDDDVFLAFMTQLDCFFLHGTGRDGLSGYFKDPDDMGVALMPRGCAVSLDRKGSPVREGKRSITTGGWWWGIPANTPDPRASYRLARFITSTENQIQECTRFGMIPVRKDILSQMSMMFGGGWITHIYDTSFRQLMENKHTTIPSSEHFESVSEAYLAAWYDIVVDGNWSPAGNLPQRDHIEQVLRAYQNKVAMVLR